MAQAQAAPPRKGGGKGRWIVLALVVVLGVGALAAIGGAGSPGASPVPSDSGLAVGPSASPVAAVSLEPTASALDLPTPDPSGDPLASLLPSASTGLPTVPPLVTPDPTASPSPTPRPTPALKPLVYGKLSYTSAACWETNWTDADGHDISGGEISFAITIRNPNTVKSRNLWIGIRTTDWSTTDPLITKASWKHHPAWGDEKTIVIAGPRIAPGKTRISWRVFMQTPFDVHYTVYIVEGPDPTTGEMSYDEIEAASDGYWDPWTSMDVCY